MEIRDSQCCTSSRKQNVPPPPPAESKDNCMSLNSLRTDIGSPVWGQAWAGISGRSPTTLAISTISDTKYPRREAAQLCKPSLKHTSPNGVLIGDPLPGKTKTIRKVFRGANPRRAPPAPPKRDSNSAARRTRNRSYLGPVRQTRLVDGLPSRTRKSQIVHITPRPGQCDTFYQQLVASWKSGGPAELLAHGNKLCDIASRRQLGLGGEAQDDDLHVRRRQRQTKMWRGDASGIGNE